MRVFLWGVWILVVGSGILFIYLFIYLEVFNNE